MNCWLQDSCSYGRPGRHKADLVGHCLCNGESCLQRQAAPEAFLSIPFLSYSPFLRQWAAAASFLSYRQCSELEGMFCASMFLPVDIAVLFGSCLEYLQGLWGWPQPLCPRRAVEGEQWCSGSCAFCWQVTLPVSWVVSVRSIWITGPSLLMLRHQRYLTAVSSNYLSRHSSCRALRSAVGVLKA